MSPGAIFRGNLLAACPNGCGQNFLVVCDKYKLCPENNTSYKGQPALYHLTKSFFLCTVGCSKLVCLKIHLFVPDWLYDHTVPCRFYAYFLSSEQFEKLLFLFDFRSTLK